MTVRNLSPQQMFIDLVRDHTPEHHFTASNKRQFQSWKRRTLPKVLATLGDFPAPVPGKAELLAEWEEKGHVVERRPLQQWMLAEGVGLLLYVSIQ